MSTLFALVLVFATLATVIVGLHHNTRCKQIEHILANVKPGKKRDGNLAFLNRSRRQARNRTLLLTCAVWVVAVVAFKFVDIDAILNAGAFLVAALMVIFVELRKNRHEELNPSPQG